MAIKLTGLSSQNPWWRDKNWEKEDTDIGKIERVFYRKNIDVGKVTIVRGMRRIGKTVYAKILIKKIIESGVEPRKILYISCDRYSPKEIKNIIQEFLMKANTVVAESKLTLSSEDIYEGEELPEGKKNLAFHIIYQAEDRTLTNKEIDEIQNKIIEVLEENLEWTVRK